MLRPASLSDASVRTPAGRLALTALVLVLAACAAPKKATVAEPATLKNLEQRQVTVAPDPGIDKREETAAMAYKDFLKAAPKDPNRAEALRRLGDLEMERVERQIADSNAGNPKVDYGAAIKQYLDFLKTFPNDPGNDRVLYQLARAYELSGQLETSLKTLDRLVTEYPKSRHIDEAQFRRGEVLFTLRDYGKAEQAYATTMRAGEGSPYFERALYMHGWTLFKQSRLEEAVASFFKVLDRKLIGKGDVELEQAPGLTRADRELLDDTFRVTSLSLENLQSAASIPPYINSPGRREYEFRVYQQLAELFIKQDRVKDASDTFVAFAQRQPQHPQAPVMMARVIDLYQRGGFETLALEAKKAYVAQYGARSEFARANPAAWEKAQPLVKTHLGDLARYYHAAAQKGKKSADYQEAVKWYRAYLDAFPNDPQAAQNNFLLAELLFEDSRFNEAAAEYEKAAYGYPKHAKSADAGYAALLAYVQMEKRAAAPDLKKVQLAGVDSALRFSKAFPDDTRNGAVLTNAAEKLFTLNDPDRAVAIAQQVVALNPPVAAPQRKVAWTVIAHTMFERAKFDQAEKAYGQVLALTPEKDAARNDLTERLAASIYKQGEQARAQNKLRDAVAHFNRVAEAAPTSSVRPNAQFDAAAALLALKDWDAATRTLEDFRTRFPKHALQDEVSSKLALAYGEKGNWAQAAAEFERLSAVNKDPQLARSGLWQAAEMYEKGNAKAQAARVYERYVKQYPQPLEPAMEARYRLAKYARDDGNAARELALMKELQQADLTAGGARTPRTRYLGATAALALAQPAVDDYKKVALVEPLKVNLKVKKAKFETALKGFAAASEYGVADINTAATFRTAELYADFGKALINSQRPKNLSKLELEQYNVLLEEQAFPFEEKAIELHEVNAHRTADGIYDKWVKESFMALAKLRPARYGKVELSEVVVDAIR
jgi:TolA-binding protein